MGQQNNKYDSVVDLTTYHPTNKDDLKENNVKMVDLREIQIIYLNNSITILQDGKNDVLNSTVLLKDKIFKNLVIIFQNIYDDTSNISSFESNFLSELIDLIENSQIENLSVLIENDKESNYSESNCFQLINRLLMNYFLKAFKKFLKVEIKNVFILCYDSQNVLKVWLNNNTNISILLSIQIFISNFFPSFSYEINSSLEHFSDRIKCYFEQITNTESPQKAMLCMLPNIYIDESVLTDEECLIDYLYTFNCFLKYINKISEKTKSINLNITVFKVQLNGKSEIILMKILNNLKKFSKIIIIFEIVYFYSNIELDCLRNYFLILIKENSFSRIIKFIIKKQNTLIKQLIFNYNLIEPLILSFRSRNLLRKIPAYTRIFTKIYNFLLDDYN